MGISDCDGLDQNIILLTIRGLEKATVERRDEGTQIAGSFRKQDQVTDIEQMPLNLLYLAAYFPAFSFDKQRILQPGKRTEQWPFGDLGFRNKNRR